jgi:hypothetical protein
MTSTLKTALAIALAGAAIQQASAAWISGDISFEGSAVLNAAPATATSITAYLKPTVGLGTQSGTYTGTDGDSVNFAPFTFSPIASFAPVTLWSFFDVAKSSTFSFKALGLTSATTTTSGGISFINIEGIGVASATGYSDTPGSFSLTFTSKKATGTFAAYTVVPEPTTYAMVAGLSLVGFGLWRRRA